MNNILIIHNGPPYAAERSTMQVLSEHGLHADKVIVLQ